MKRFSDFKKGDMFFFNPLNLDFMQPEVYVMVDESIVQDTNTKSLLRIPHWSNTLSATMSRPQATYGR